MQKLVIASGNKGKLRELSALLEPLNYDVHTQAEFNVPEAEETGTTFVENAIIKARNASKYTGFPAVADDSGIEVDALQGAPGVYSARFSGPNATDDQNNALLVKKLSSVAPEKRTARYRAVIVYMRHEKDPSPLICDGSWEGHIILEPQGEGGFGYDPYFYLDAQKCTSAQLTSDHKNSISHRGKALKKLLEKLSS